MRINEDIAVRSSKVLLVPYDRRHVVRYHQWMADPAIQEATASEPLTLDEEYENQESWRASHDKLTFILCQPPAVSQEDCEAGRDMRADVDDAPDRMIGDINFFLYPWDDEDEVDQPADRPEADTQPACCIGEVDVMIADSNHRGQGIGNAAVVTFLQYIHRNLDTILQEYAASQEGGASGPRTPARELKLFMVKIKENNASSIALFRRLGFVQEGEVNYFGEIKMTLADYEPLLSQAPDGYAELRYVRN